MGRVSQAATDDAPIRIAYAHGGEAADAAADLRLQLPVDDYSAILIFISPEYHAPSVATAMAKQFPATPIFGCTTAGELGPKGIGDGGLLALAFCRGDFSIVASGIKNIDALAFDGVRDNIRQARAALSECERGAQDRHRFGLLLVDGLCLHEDALVSTIGACLDDIQVVGGSAGDGGSFRETWIVFDGQAHRNAAVLLLVSSDVPCRLFKCNSFAPTSTKLVVTEADVERRIVRELNAEPAALEYARTIGVPVGELNGHVFAAHPVIVRIGGDYYARSIQRANEDGSLTFFCAIDEGLVLTAAGRLNTLGVVETMFHDAEAELGEVSAYIGFDCVYRRLDAEQRQIIRDMEDLYVRHNVVGFNTYGEQYQSMHLNQTFSGVAVGKRKAR